MKNKTKNSFDSSTAALEGDLEEALEIGSFNKAKRARREISRAIKAAGNYLKKDSRLNIRLSSSDILSLKRRAAEEGLPYQTLIASVLHKFITGRLVNR